MPLLLLRILGRLLSLTPEPLLHALAIALGETMFVVLPRRRRLILSNLHHAFPDRPPAWHRATGRASCRRLIETALLSAATPCLGERRLRRILRAAPPLTAALARQESDPAPTLICSPHLAYWEAQTSMALVVPGAFPEFGTIYRPLNHAGADAWVRRSRERFGIRMLSRRDGFAEALKILRRRGFVGVLFDQNAGLQGALTTLFGRVCSTSELPGLMAEKFGARVYGIFPRRLGFWRVEISVQLLQTGGTSSGTTIALNRWLESLLPGDDNLCASWLWAHDRWRNQDMPERRLRLEAKRSLLPDEMRMRGLAVLPRRTRFRVRLPNWLGDVIMTVPWLRALRRSRPDAEITLVARPHFLPLLREWNLADRLEALPPRGGGYFAHFWRIRRSFPDCTLLFTNSFRGDLEAWLTRSPQRFGIVRPGHPRQLLSADFTPPAGFDETTRHQLDLWGGFLRHFGLLEPPDRSPVLAAPDAGNDPPIALIPGSENAPEKRWPVLHWRRLIAALPDRHFVLFGTEGDRPVTAAIAEGDNSSRIEDLAGQTDLPTLVRRLRACRLLVTNDTGGMHLANAAGVPLIALFGPTNPVRTGPVFSAPVRILQPPGCPAAGGADLADLRPEAVVSAVNEFGTATADRLPAE